jgi:hypothetical protein
MSDAKFKEVMTRLECKTEEDLIERLLEANSELLEAIYDLQWFMEEKDLTSKDFRKWQKEKELRIYH